MAAARGALHAADPGGAPRARPRGAGARHGDALWERAARTAAARSARWSRLAEALREHEAWISAIRADQTADRASARVVERDATLRLVKVNPLLAWSSEDVWDYLRENDVPTNPLHERGYPSIGCGPCTSPVLPGEDPRAGRWRGRIKTECGLHARPSVLPSSPSPQEKEPSQHVPGPVASPGAAPRRRARRPHRRRRGGRATLRQRAESLPRPRPRRRASSPTSSSSPIGAASPLTGFLGEADYASVVEHLRLADGTVWPLPFTLAVPDETARPRAAGRRGRAPRRVGPAVGRRSR